MSAKKPFILGLTGGIGAGKSTVSKLFQAKGIPVLDADALAREVVLPGSDGLGEIRAAFGDGVLGSDGALDRAKLRTLISQDPTVRKQLEAITHPKIQALGQQKTQALAAQGAAIIIYEAPLLFEAGSDKRTDAVVTVIADDALRIQRVMKRDQSTHAEAESLLRAQMAQEEKAKRSRWVIANNGPVESLAAQVDRICDEILGH